ncbi:hypothetical protein BJ166DRAFT_528319 [Pestalotiopsis sp. NC0098]|nr:hypothetical protein BJ166DRAFT_528319 [Pestalotiopsis sp. NC0098]
MPPNSRCSAAESDCFFWLYLALLHAKQVLLRSYTMREKADVYASNYYQISICHGDRSSRDMRAHCRCFPKIQVALEASRPHKPRGDLELEW